MSLQIPRLEKAQADHINQENAGVFFRCCFISSEKIPKWEKGQGGVEGLLPSKCFPVLGLSPSDLTTFQALQRGCPQLSPCCPGKSRLRVFCYCLGTSRAQGTECGALRDPGQCLGTCWFGGYARSSTQGRCPPCSALTWELLRSPDISCSLP